jgi:hypothetical protein
MIYKTNLCKIYKLKTQNLSCTIEIYQNIVTTDKIGLDQVAQLQERIYRTKSDNAHRLQTCQKNLGWVFALILDLAA